MKTKKITFSEQLQNPIEKSQKQAKPTCLTYKYTTSRFPGLTQAGRSSSIVPTPLIENRNKTKMNKHCLLYC